MLDKKIKYKDVIFSCCVIVAFILLCVNLYLCFFDNLWIDEVFSMYIIEGSYLDILINTAIDVHPPLYYFILKFFVDFIKIIMSSINVIVVAKIISFSSIIAIFYFFVYKMPKIADKLISGFLLLAMFSFNPFEEFSITIRMYGYALLFCVLCLYYTIKIIKENNSRDWRFFVLFFELSAYTHYFGLIASAGLLLYLLIYFFIKDRKNFITALYYTIFCIVIYVPWLTVLCCQFAYIKSYGYWISSMQGEDIGNMIKFIVNPGFSQNNVITIVLCIIFVLLFILVLFSRKIKKQEKWICFAGLFSMIFLIVVGLSISYLITPIFIKRYVIPALLNFYFSIFFAIYLLIKNYCQNLNTNNYRLKNSLNYVVQSIVFISVVLSAIASVVYLSKDEKITNDNHQKNAQILQTCANAVIIIDYGQTQCQLEYLYDVKNLGLIGGDVSWWENVSGIKHETIAEENIVSLIENNEMVLFVQNHYSLINLEKYGIEYKIIDTLYMERSAASIYELTLKDD